MMEREWVTWLSDGERVIVHERYFEGRHGKIAGSGIMVAVEIVPRVSSIAWIRTRSGSIGGSVTQNGF